MQKRTNKRHHPDLIKASVSYDPETGEFVWLVRPNTHFPNDRDARRWNAAFSGKRCGSKVQGRWVICVCKQKYPASHIAWVLTYGRWPQKCIDHINGDPLDNRLNNLREVTARENNMNLSLYRKNKTGVHGVYQDKWGNWYSQIGVNGSRITLGYFSTFDEAKTARLKAEVEYGYHPNHGRAA